MLEYINHFLIANVYMSFCELNCFEEKLIRFSFFSMDFILIEFQDLIISLFNLSQMKKMKKISLYIEIFTRKELLHTNWSKNPRESTEHRKRARTHAHVHM